jgi:formylglycine-generating enzyme required for sulfatase activity
MVVDISDAAQPNTQRYYPAVDFLPGSALGQTGAVTNNPAYKTTMIVMRKIMAKGVTWTMGSTDAETKFGRDVTKEATHQVALTNNYYIGVFEVTQAQWALIHQGENDSPSQFANVPDHAMRPVEQVCFNEIRMGDGTAAAADSLEWPGAPHSSSFLGFLRNRTDIDFDLPSEAQWEFAARAGNGDTKWGDGSAMISAVKCTNLISLGRYTYSGGNTDGTAVVGSYKANDWGLYDMHGNACEWCLDWFAANISKLEGAVNTDSASGTRVLRSGAYNQDAKFSRPACRTLAVDPSRNTPSGIGFRLACRAGLD